MGRLLAEASKTSVDLKKVVERLTKQAEKILNDALAAQGSDSRVRASFKSDPGRGGYGPYEIGEIGIESLRLRVIGDVKDGSVSTGARSGENALESYFSKGPASGAAARVKEVAERFAKLALPRSQAAKKPAETKPQALQGVQTSEFVVTLLNGRNTKAGGRLKVGAVEEEFVEFEPYKRQRLDHYGNDGEGWDEEGWETDYAGPLRAEVRAILKTGGATQWDVEIGEKGHVEVYRSTK
jgi:hypothetical protein